VKVQVAVVWPTHGPLFHRYPAPEVVDEAVRVTWPLHSAVIVTVGFAADGVYVAVVVVVGELQGPFVAVTVIVFEPGASSNVALHPLALGTVTPFRTYVYEAEVSQLETVTVT